MDSRFDWKAIHCVEVVLARSNYKHEKRQKDLARQKKQEEKRKRRLEKKKHGDGDTPETAPDGIQTDNQQSTES